MNRDQYAAEFVRMAKEEGLTCNTDNIKKAMSGHSIEDIERMFDAFSRFGIKAVLDAVQKQ